MNAIEIEDICFSHETKDVLKNISFSIKPGEILCIFGPNGCGKTTMLECILGIRDVDSGTIKIMEDDIRLLNEKDIAKKVAFVPQFQEATFGYSVLEMVLMGRTPNTGMFSSPNNKDIDIAEKALMEVGIYELKDHNYNKLSGGEAQLVKLARSIAQDTEILILDEPTAHLDFRNELKVIKQISTMAKAHNMSIVMATHFPNHAFFFDREGNDTTVAIMDDGVIQSIGSAGEVLSEKNMERIFGIKAKIYEDIEDGKKSTYIMPIDFVQGRERS